MKRKKWLNLIIVMIITSLFLTNITNTHFNANAIEPIANLVLKTRGGGVRPDYGLFISQYLKEIGVEVEVRVEEWVVFLTQLLFTRNYDLAIVGMIQSLYSPDVRDFQTQNGSMNFYGMSNKIPYCNESDEMLIEGSSLTDIVERQQLYYNWQELLMNHILPILPLYTARNYWALWSNTLGYDHRWDFYDSLPYMSWDGFHFGQESLDELNLDEGYWQSLNPLNAPDLASFIFISLIMEK